jgi:hypothetical protein
MTVIRSGRSILFGVPTPSMRNTPFKRNRREVSPHRNGRLNGFGNGSNKPRRVMKDGAASEEVNSYE